MRISNLTKIIIYNVINKKVTDETSVVGPITEASLSSMSWYALGIKIIEKK
jgi:hypothetical protein